MSDDRSGKTNINLDLVQVLDLGCGILRQLFFKLPESRAKAALKDLKNGSTLSLGEMTLRPKGAAADTPEAGKVPLALELDYSEFRGPGFSFPVYRAALNAMLDKIALAMRAKKDLNILTNQQTGGMLIHQPGVIQLGEQINVLLLAIEPPKTKKGGVVFRLMFVDPDQYKRKDAEQVSPEA